MAGRWDEPQERGYRSYEDRYDVFGLNDERDRGADRGREDRSFEQDRVFGERESGVSYNRPQQGRGQDRIARRDEARSGQGWQSPNYGGVSPAMQRGDYDTGYRTNPRVDRQDYTRGGRFYGDDGRGRVYREAYGADSYEYGPAPRDLDQGRRFGTREADERWTRETGRPLYADRYGAGTYSGGTGGYDYERGYGDGGRGDEGRDHEAFEDRAREAGEFFRRTGRKLSSWFNDFGREHDRQYASEAYGYDRGHRGVGPKGYKRSDERISDEAHQRLTDDPWVDASDVTVTVADGEVTLSGQVDGREAKHRAERIVEHLSGVNHVQNNLRTKPAGSYLTRGGEGSGDGTQALRHEGDASIATSANARHKT